MGPFRRVVLVTKEFERGQAERGVTRLRETLPCERIDLIAPTRKGHINLPTDLGPRDLLVLCIRGLPHTVSDTVQAFGRSGVTQYVVVRKFSLSMAAEIAQEFERIRGRKGA